jgi:hypothetical protein
VEEHVFVSRATTRRELATWEERWQRKDQGLIAAWEAGRELALRDPDLALRARRGELVPLPYKGGVATRTKVGRKYGALHYVAMWQGLRDQDLDVVLGRQIEMICTHTEMRVIFTDDVSLLLNAELQEQASGPT